MKENTVPHSQKAVTYSLPFLNTIPAWVNVAAPTAGSCGFYCRLIAGDEYELRIKNCDDFSMPLNGYDIEKGICFMPRVDVTEWALLLRPHPFVN